MKNPLMYQQTECDCGEIAIKNALSILYEREEMPLELVHILSSYSRGCYGEDGELLDNSFSKNILFFVASWVKDYANEKHISLTSKFLRNDEVDFQTIKRVLGVGGVVVLKTFKRGTHFVTITSTSEDEVCIFDPLYMDSENSFAGVGVEVVNDKPFEYNRKIKIEEFQKENKTGLCLGAEESREALVLIRENAILQREFN